MSNRIYLMYHELMREGHTLCAAEEGYARYCVTHTNFVAQMNCLKQTGARGLSVSEALADEARNSHGVCITFDDGCATDLSVAAPVLREFDFNATFYVVAGFTGRRGYLAREDVRELSALGFEIGSHSMTHPYLSDLTNAELNTELSHSKTLLEDLTGKPVKHFSCPGGRWDEHVVAAAQSAGYATVATSRIGRNGRNANRFALRRIAVMRDTSLDEFEATCRGRNLLRKQAATGALGVVKTMLGNKGYERLRAKLLSRERTAADAQE